MRLIILFIGYIAIGVLVSAIFGAIENHNGDIPYGLIVFIWPIAIALCTLLFSMVIIPAYIGEKIGNFLKKIKWR